MHRILPRYRIEPLHLRLSYTGPHDNDIAKRLLGDRRTMGSRILKDEDGDPTVLVEVDTEIRLTPLYGYSEIDMEEMVDNQHWFLKATPQFHPSCVTMTLQHPELLPKQPALVVSEKKHWANASYIGVRDYKTHSCILIEPDDPSVIGHDPERLWDTVVLTDRTDPDNLVPNGLNREHVGHFEVIHTKGTKVSSRLNALPHPFHPKAFKIICPTPGRRIPKP